MESIVPLAMFSYILYKIQLHSIVLQYEFDNSQDQYTIYVQLCNVRAENI